MNFLVSRLKIIVSFVLLILVFFACTKITNTTLGGGLLPPADNVNTKDTVLDIMTKNEGIDTAAVGISDNHVLGYLSDNSFGTTNAAINFQVGSAVYPLALGADANKVTLDSVVLSFSYQGVWGDSTQPLAISVYQMDNENRFTSDSLYATTKTFEKGLEITQSNTPAIIYPVTLNDIDTIQKFSEVTTNTLRIHLNNSFGQQLINQAGSAVYTNDSTFHTFLRGLIVQPQPSGNSLLQFSLTDTSTHLSIYYHYVDSASNKDTAVTRRFTVNSSTSASSNTILRSYTGTISGYIPSNQNPEDDLLYIQTTPGTHARLKIPGLDTLPNMIIHRAEILMTQAQNISQSSYFTPPNLFLSAYSKDTMVRFAIPNAVDFSSGTISNITSFGVIPILIPNTKYYRYSFDITRYVQGIVTRKDTAYDLILWAPYNYYLRPTLATPYTYPIASPSLNSVAIGRIILGGGNNSQYKMRLHIVYSTIN